MGILDKIIQVDKYNNIGLLGMTDEFFCAYINKMFNESKSSILILTSTLYEANKIYSSLEKYNDKTLLFPMDDFLTSESIAVSPELKSTRLDTLNELVSGSNYIVVSHLNSFLRFLPSKETFKSKKVLLEKGKSYNRNKLIDDLISIGYKRETIVTNTGEIGIRGFVLDIYPINYETPVRIEFFDDEIESLRYFDPDTQKSISEINNIEISPNTEFLINGTMNDIETNQKYLEKLGSDVTNIVGYMNNPITIIKDFSQLKASYKKLLEEITDYKTLKDTTYKGNYMFSLEEVLPHDVVYYNTIDNYFGDIAKSNIYDFAVQKVPEFHENVDLINTYLEKELLKKKTIVIYLKDYQVRAFTKYLTCKYVLTTDDDIYESNVNIVIKDVNEGFIYGNFIFLTPKELFSKKADVKYKSRYKYTSKIKSINNLEIGDYVVHALNGIGIYNGIKTLTQGSLKKDYIEILYAGNDKLYIPVEKIELIGKFTGKEGVAPKISKLGGTEWQKTKLRIKNKVGDIAKKLLELYAKRNMQKGFAFSRDDEMQTLFDNEFEFEETPDQKTAIETIKADMESDKPMDRLLCGDVGYGKTEVAFRAMFKAVDNSKQVLYLCPTTILSSQQYENAKERFKNFPVEIALLNRFTTPKETKRIITALNDGKIDILFGTHRLLGKDIKPKDLGLLVIDEEQRFGVAHKEKIKEYKENVDVLTLTATPIPRTLQMSLVGIRSLSLIETPPVDRYPIQTYVIEENKALVRDAIYKEMSRGGQVFILYNRVADIERKMLEIQSLVPDAKIVCTHGQLSKIELEDRMADFIDRKYDVMLCTTIIETGIDINNVNTLIIYNADRFGLSQLYQIRGRVGRSNKIAYAYLMYSKDKILGDVAVKRLNAIKEFTELGSGFSIASRDLSIRGAGDILGSEQAGFIDSVGIDLYLKILNEEVDRLKGIKPKEENVSKNNLLNVSTHISDNYVEDNDLKIEIHKLINTVDSKDKFLEVKAELEDRFGKLDEDIIIYMYEEWFEALAYKVGIFKVKQTNQYIELYFSKEASSNINGEELFVASTRISNGFKFKYSDESLKIIFDIRGLDKHFIYYLVDLLNAITSSK